MQQIIDKLNEAFLPKNIECDGPHCMGCWKDVVREDIKMLEKAQQCDVKGSLPLKLPLDKSFYKQCNECLRWRMIGTQCKNPLTMMCDNDEKYFL